MAMSFHTREASQADHAVGEAFFLWCFRRWVRGLCHNDAGEWEEVWNEAARRFGAAEGRRFVSALARCVNVLHAHAATDFAYHQPCCTSRSLEEAALTDIVACSAGQAPRAAQLARAIVRLEASADILQAAVQINRVLAAHDMPIPPTNGRIAVQGALDSKAATLH